MLEQYKAKAEHYLCSCLGRNGGNGSDNVERSPGGMLYMRQWNNLQYGSSAAFLLTVYSHYLSDANTSSAGGRGQGLLRFPAGAHAAPSDLLALAHSQADYILGRNPPWFRAMLRLLLRISFE